MTWSFIAIVLSLQAQAATHVPLVVGQCEVGDVGDVSGVANTPNGLAILDRFRDQITFFDSDCTATRAPLSVASFSDDAQAITWADDLMEYGIVDGTLDTLFFVGSGGLNGSCDLATIGASNAVGVARDVIDGQYHVLRGNQIFVLDDSVRNGGSCGLVTTITASSGNDLVIDPLGRTTVFNGQDLRVVDDGGALVDLIPLNRTPASDDGAVWDPDDSDYVLSLIDRTLYRLDVRGTVAQVCNTSTTSVGMSIGPTPGEVVVADANGRAVRVIDTTTCASTRTINVSSVVNDLTAAAWDLGRDEIVVAGMNSQSIRGLYFLDASTEALKRTCDLEQSAVPWPSGLEILPDLGLIAVTSEDAGSWALLDRNCRSVHVRSTASIADAARRMLPPTEVGWLPASGRFVLSDDQIVAITDYEGNVKHVLDLENHGQGADGVAPIPGEAAAFYTMDAGRLYRVDLPALGENLDPSGHFVSPSAEFFLWSRGAGRVTGQVEFGGNTLPLWGQWSTDRATLYLSTLKNGSPASLQLSVSPDASTMTGPGPIGALVRD